MTPRVPKALSRLDSRQQEMLGTVREMTEEQRSSRVDDDGWTPVQVVHHVFLAEKRSIETMEKVAGRQSAPRTVAQNVKKAMVWLVLKTGIRVKNPSRVTTPDPSADFQEIEREWPTLRTRLREVIGSTDEARTTAGFQHPISGPLSVAESVEFLAAHIEHHLRQLTRIRSSPGFPAS